MTAGEQIGQSAAKPERLISTLAAAPAAIADIAPVDAAREVVHGLAQSNLLASASSLAAGATTALDTVANLAAPVVTTGEQDVSNALGAPLATVLEQIATPPAAARIVSAGQQAVSAVLGGSLSGTLEAGEQQQPASPSLPALNFSATTSSRARRLG